MAFFLFRKVLSDKSIEGFPVLVTDRDALVAENDPATFNGSDLLQVYDVRAVYSHELVCRQLAFQ